MVHFQVIDVIEAMFKDIFAGIESTCQAELEAVRRQFPFEPFVMKPMRFTYAEGVKARRVQMWSLYSVLCATLHARNMFLVLCTDIAGADHAVLLDLPLRVPAQPGLAKRIALTRRTHPCKHSFADAARERLP
jgi:hypothetical protein